MSQSTPADPTHPLKMIEQSAEHADMPKPKGKCICDCGDCPCAGKRQAAGEQEHSDEKATTGHDSH